MFKIAIDARMIYNSGIGTYLQNMIPNLLKNYELILLGKEKEIKNFPWADKVQIIIFDNPIYSLSEQLILPIKIPECDIFLSPHYNVPIFPIRGKKRLVIIHDVYHLAFNSKLTLSQKFYSKLMIYFAVHLSDHIITSSEFSKSEILKYEKVKESKINVVHFGFDFEKFSNLASNFEPIKKKYNLPGRYFLFVSNIKPHKNLYNLLLALKISLGKENGIKLVVVGEYKKLITSDEKSFELMDKNPLLKNSTIFTGFVDKEELVLLYKNASALVFPSFYEGFGIPPVEAMACGCPVISSNSASLPEVCGNASLYVNPDDINDIAEKMDRVISDITLRDKLVNKGKENIKRFSNEIFSNNINKVLTSLHIIEF
jgi:glycosyltransferase involved in cell wall biosynthesis